MNFVLVEALTFGLGRLVAAAEEFGVSLHLLTHNKNIYFYELGHIDSKNLIVAELNTFNQKEIIAYCRGLENFSGIINLTDTWTDSVREISAILGCQGQNPLSTALCRDKFQLRNTLADKGLTKGRAYSIPVENFAPTNALHYPLIVKDPSGTGSKNVWFADKPQELSAILSFVKQQTKLSAVLAETYFKGTLYSAETVSYKGNTKFIALTSRILSDMPYFMEKAAALPLNTDNDELRGVENWVGEILAALSYTDGFAHTEFIITDSGFEVVEVNPRLGGGQIGEALCRAFSYNIYKAFIEMAMGIEPEIFRFALVPQTYIGQVLVYAGQKGRFSGIDTNHINAGKTDIFPCAAAGKMIDNLHNQSACAAIILSSGAGSELALLNALSEANKVKVYIETSHV